MDFYSLLSLILITLAVSVMISIVYYSLRLGISPMPSSKLASNTLIEMAPSLTSGVIYELGSGWGNVAFKLARKFPKCQVIAFEQSIMPYFFSRLIQFYFKHPNLIFYRDDFFNRSLADGTLIVCYLFPNAMIKLEKKLKSELKSTSWIITNTFALPDWQPVSRIELTDLYRTKIYLYQVKSHQISLTNN